MAGRDQFYNDYPGLANSDLSQVLAQMEWRPGLEVNQSILDFGTLFHTATLEPDKLGPEMAQMFEGRKAPKEWMDRILRMRSAALSEWEFYEDLIHPRAQVEVQRFGVLRGHRAKGITDLKRGPRIWDLKSTSCNSLKSFLDHFKFYGYFRQGYWYKRLTRAQEVTFLGVQKTSPFRTFMVDLSDHPWEVVKAKRELNRIFKFYNQLPRAAQTRYNEKGSIGETQKAGIQFHDQEDQTLQVS